MGMKITGFDQITAWISGAAISGLIFTGVWYAGKYMANRAIEADEQRAAAAQHDLKNLRNDTPAEHESQTSSKSEASTQHVTDHELQNEPLEHWGYTGNLAPWYWNGLNTKWAACGAKTGQSPIDISGAKLDESLKSLKFYYTHGITHMTLLHETVQGEVDHGSYMEWDGERYDLHHVMFRTPSEHRVNSLPWEMEIQLEHVAVTGKIILLSFLVTPGKPSELINYLTTDLPRMEGEVKDIERVNWGACCQRSEPTGPIPAQPPRRLASLTPNGLFLPIKSPPPKKPSTNSSCCKNQMCVPSIPWVNGYLAAVTAKIKTNKSKPTGNRFHGSHFTFFRGRFMGTHRPLE